MKNTLFKKIGIFLLIVFGVILGMFVYKTIEKKSVAKKSVVIFRPQTQEESFSSIIFLKKLLPWLKQEKYPVALPENKEFKKVYSKSENFSKTDINYLRKIFYTEVYNVAFFEKGLKVIRTTKNIVEKAIERFAILNKHWKFKLMPKYEIILTLYGTSGQYNASSGKITIKTTPKGTFLRKNASYSIIHEMAHIGIQENIVDKYKLTHWEKERLVDLICSIYLKDLLPNYEIQKIKNNKLDGFINNKVILYNLPSAISNFIAQYPRQH